MSSGEQTTAVPRSRAAASTASAGSLPLDSTSSPTPSSIEASCASSRLPTTATSPSWISLGSWPISIAITHTRPAIWRSSPATCRPSRTSTIALTRAGASSREARRDSRM